MLLPLSSQVNILLAQNLLSIDIGSAYGTMKASVGICSTGVNKPTLILKSLVPVIMAGILGVYGLIVAVILITKSMFYEKDILII